MAVCVPDEFIALANEMADTARRVILPFWRQGIEVQSKIESQRAILESPVTIADRNTEVAMRELVEARYPSHGISGEEYGDVRLDAKWVWVLDPIDGTKSFITGKPLFGTLIGLLCDGVPVLGTFRLNMRSKYPACLRKKRNQLCHTTLNNWNSCLICVMYQSHCMVRYN